VIIRDILFEKKCARNIDCVAAISKEPLIWNCKTVSIDNAVNMEDVPIKAPRKGKGDDLVLISVAVEQPYHAYYRLINGIGRYYENGGGRNIKLYMVGKYRDQTQQLVCSWKLQDHIFFVGEKSGRELDLLFDESDIAVGTFGKRGGSEFGSSIKSKEYFARGIPFINGWREYAFDDDCPYVLRFPLDDTDIDIHKVLAFYDALRERSDVSVKMREFAEQNFTWDGQYEKLFGEIFEGTGFFCDSSLQKS
jgi:glycosyltransferase involved in cell wall biosynthesis